MIPGEIRTGSGVLEINAGREIRYTTVVNDGDRPIQVGSHLHLPDANPALSFDRALAEGFRLDIPSGTSLRFEPGVGADVALVALGGRREVPGLVVRTKHAPETASDASETASEPSEAASGTPETASESADTTAGEEN
ncbi:MULTISPECIES: urease subunit beta [unclassified Streptomyces]|uniref:urease subunit beta n=1 Tax=unclassified Streptomyces TaxID=2593676 RepID=UPI000CD5ADF2|nr:MULTISPECIES: urease subunit beta [unclassified Streptomyces]AWL41460.1 urease subunit beta [Streptomyces sp. SM18]